jgi:pyrroline-5-carboxylate reductase
MRSVNTFSKYYRILTLLLGTLGTAILSGILSSLSSPRESIPSATPSGISTPYEELPEHIPRHFIACVTSSHSARRIEKALPNLKDNLTILQNKNLAGVQEADVILLGCKPQMVKDILLAPGIRDALAGKLLISILAGVPVSQIEEILYPEEPSVMLPKPTIPFEERCRIVRVMPNTASRINESMTVIAKSTPPLPSHLESLVEWIFRRIGQVVHLSPALMDVSTALCGSGPAFFSLFMEAITDGAVAMGIPRKEAQFMAAQTMKGTAGLVLDGDHPALLRDKVCTPGGCTIGGLLVLEEGTVRGTAAKCLREATEVASQLGRGVQGVNGTRFATRS